MDQVAILVAEVLRTAPRWITAEIVHETVELFEPVYQRQLTAEEVREMIVNASRFFDLAKQLELNAKVCCTGEGE